MKLKDKKIKVLEDLYKNRFDNKYHSILKILEMLGPTNEKEASSIAKKLYDEGLIDLVESKSGVFAEILPDGIELIENEESDDGEYEPIDLFQNQERGLIIEKLDEFSEKLRRLEIGQQIIYDDLKNEIETLKKLLNVLEKKDWRQIFKGKLLDAGMGQLTDEVSELLISTFGGNKFLGQ